MRIICKLIFLFTFILSYSTIAEEKALPLPIAEKKIEKEVSFKQKTIRLFKKWTYWDYLYKPKWVENYLGSLEEKETNNQLPSTKIAEKTSSIDQKAAEAKTDNQPKQADLGSVKQIPPIELPSLPIDKTPVAPRLPEEDILASKPTTSPVELAKIEEPAAPVAPRLPEEDILASKPTTSPVELAKIEEPAVPVAPRLPEEDILASKPTTSPAELAKIEEPAAPLAPRLPEEDILASKPTTLEETQLATATVPTSANASSNTTSPDTQSIKKENTQTPTISSDTTAKNLQQTSNIPSLPHETSNLITESQKLLEEADKEILLSLGKTEKEIEVIKQKTPEMIAKEEQMQKELEKYISDELAMLLLPQDEISLGKLTFSAKMTYADDTSYLQTFWEGYNKAAQLKRDQLIRQYIKAIKRPAVELDPEYAILASAEATSKGDISNLRAIINHTKLNLVNLSQPDFNLLITAASNNQYDTVYYLLMRGTNVSRLTLSGEPLLSSLEEETSPSIIWLLKRTGGQNYSYISK